jgi:outer membrane lipoprotein-sorting protein
MQYFPDEKRAERMPSRTDGDLRSIFPGFGQSSEEMGKTYEIRLLSTPDDDESWKLDLRPRLEKMKRLLSRIVLCLDPDSGVPTRLRIDDPNGKDYTEMIFSETKVNQGLPESRTRLDLPEGIRITTVTGHLPF